MIKRPCRHCKKYFDTNETYDLSYCSRRCKDEYVEKSLRETREYLEAKRTKHRNAEIDRVRKKEINIRRNKHQQRNRIVGSKRQLKNRIRNLEDRIKELEGFPKENRVRIRDFHKFYDSEDWRQLRYKALKLHGRICALCKTTDGVMHVDHIKPRSFHPELALDINNLQILCRPCNLGKSNKDETDFREIKPL